MLDWYRKKTILEGFKRPQKLKHVRQLRLSRTSQQLDSVLHQVCKGPRNLKIVKCGKPRVLILREIRRGRANINLNHVRQLSPSRVSHQKARVLEEIKSIQEPTRSRVSCLKARALDQIIKNPTQLKPIHLPQQASPQNTNCKYR